MWLSLFLTLFIAGSLQLFHCQTWWQALSELLCLSPVLVDNKCVEVAAASHFELHILLSLLDFHRFGILSPGCHEELLDFQGLIRHFDDFHFIPACNADVNAKRKLAVLSLRVTVT